ncbi:MAG: hypothetical protein ABSB82_19725 [Terriglobia bacterium]
MARLPMPLEPRGFSASRLPDSGSALRTPAAEKALLVDILQTTISEANCGRKMVSNGTLDD